jgi:hypothetical protein
MIASDISRRHFDIIVREPNLGLAFLTHHAGTEHDRREAARENIARNCNWTLFEALFGMVLGKGNRSSLCATICT